MGRNGLCSVLVLSQQWQICRTIKAHRITASRPKSERAGLCTAGQPFPQTPGQPTGKTDQGMPLELPRCTAGSQVEGVAAAAAEVGGAHATVEQGRGVSGGGAGLLAWAVGRNDGFVWENPQKVWETIKLSGII